MKRRYSLLIVVVLTLLLVACSPYRKSPVVDAQAVQPTATVKASEAPGTTVSTSLVLNEASNSCPVTQPPVPPFTPPSPYSQNAPWDNFWYGTDFLWTAVPRSGVWSGLPHNPEGYTQKVFWWRKGYSSTNEPEPQLSVIGRRLDAPAPPLAVSKATNAYAAEIGSAMLVGVDFPTFGCWEITGHYAGTELSFVVRVAP